MIDSLETARLRGERLREDHFETLSALHQDAKVMATLGGLRTTRETRVFLGKQLAHWDEHGFGLLIFCAKADGAFVARAGLRRLHIGGRDEVELAYVVAADHWGRGYATELGRALLEYGFCDLGLAEIACYTGQCNAASRRVMEKLGFVYERELLHDDGQCVLYRMTAAGWEASGVGFRCPASS